jgi:hypothetical protein
MIEALLARPLNNETNAKMRDEGFHLNQTKKSQNIEQGIQEFVKNNVANILGIMGVAATSIRDEKSRRACFNTRPTPFGRYGIVTQTPSFALDTLSKILSDIRQVIYNSAPVHNSSISTLFTVKSLTTHDINIKEELEFIIKKLDRLVRKCNDAKQADPARVLLQQAKDLYGVVKKNEKNNSLGEQFDENIYNLVRSLDSYLTEKFPGLKPAAAGGAAARGWNWRQSPETP